MISNIRDIIKKIKYTRLNEFEIGLIELSKNMHIRIYDGKPTIFSPDDGMIYAQFDKEKNIIRLHQNELWIPIVKDYAIKHNIELSISSSMEDDEYDLRILLGNVLSPLKYYIEKYNPTLCTDLGFEYINSVTDKLIIV